MAARWNAKGFGFIEPDDGGAVLFCHSREILDGKCLLPGSPVEFVRMWDDRRGKEEASEVTGGAPEEAHVFDSSRRGWAGTFDDEDREMDDAPPAGARESGVVDRWQERGFGFIRPDGGGPDVFCHAREIQDGDSLSPGNRVEFVRVWDRRRNKEEASQVTGGDGFGPNGARGAPPRAGRFAYRGGGGKAELAELMAAFYAIHRPEQVACIPTLYPDGCASFCVFPLPHSPHRRCAAPSRWLACPSSRRTLSGASRSSATCSSKSTAPTSPRCRTRPLPWRRRASGRRTDADEGWPAGGMLLGEVCSCRVRRIASAARCHLLRALPTSQPAGRCYAASRRLSARGAGHGRRSLNHGRTPSPSTLPCSSSRAFCGAAPFVSHPIASRKRACTVRQLRRGGEADLSEREGLEGGKAGGEAAAGDAGTGVVVDADADAAAQEERGAHRDRRVLRRGRAAPEAPGPPTPPARRRRERHWRAHPAPRDARATQLGRVQCTRRGQHLRRHAAAGLARGALDTNDFACAVGGGGREVMTGGGVRRGGESRAHRGPLGHQGGSARGERGAAGSRVRVARQRRGSQDLTGGRRDRGLPRRPRCPRGRRRQRPAPPRAALPRTCRALRLPRRPAPLRRPGRHLWQACARRARAARAAPAPRAPRTWRARGAASPREGRSARSGAAHTPPPQDPPLPFGAPRPWCRARQVARATCQPRPARPAVTGLVTSLDT